MNEKNQRESDKKIVPCLIEWKVELERDRERVRQKRREEEFREIWIKNRTALTKSLDRIK